jgi:hypothetical protein
MSDEKVYDEKKGIMVSANEPGKKSDQVWSKKERRILNILAVLGLINILVYFITQSSFVMQNIYWVYGIITAIDGVSFAAGITIWDDNKAHHYHPTMTPRFRNGLMALGLWLISIPIVIVNYYQPLISISLLDVANFVWNVSVAFSAGYDALYVMVIIGVWLTKGMGSPQ